jgi:hypothetical protein
VHYIGRWQQHSLKSAELHFATMVEPSKKPADFSRRVERDTHYPSRSAAKIELQDLEWRENILAKEQTACSAYSYQDAYVWCARVIKALRWSGTQYSRTMVERRLPRNTFDSITSIPKKTELVHHHGI